MNEWRRLVLGEVLDKLFDHRGRTPKKLGADWADAGVQVISAKLVSDGRLHLERERRFVAQEIYDRWMPAKLAPGDVLLTSEAPLGEAALVPAQSSLCLGQRLFALRPSPDLLDARFLFYWLRSAAGRSALNERSSGTTVSGIRQAELVLVEVPAPPIDVQRVVADVLSTIDDLIENNRRRIKLLEQMAQEIYREWFVRFRHPGQEAVTLVDSAIGPIPQDWHVKRLDQLATIVRGRSYRKHELVDSGGISFVNLKCILRGGGFRRDGVKRYDGVYNDDQRVGKGDIVLAVTDLTQGREILARATLVPTLDDAFGVISLDVVRVVPVLSADRLALLFALKCTDFPDRVKELANGSTVVHLSPAHVAGGLVAWPPKYLRDRFVDVVESMVMQLDDLNDVVDRLGAMRDLLLPKLVTGQIDVSKVDLDALLETSA